MRIRTLQRDYEILQKITYDEHMEAVIGRDLLEATDQTYLILMWKEKEDIYRFLPFCSEQKSNEPFIDFVEYFPRDGFLYMVFRYYEHQPLLQCINNEPMTFLERLAVMKSLFRRMVFLAMPCYLQYEALSEQNLRIADNGEVFFNYYLSNPEFLNETTNSDILARVASIFREVFQPEFDEKLAPELLSFTESLGNGSKLKIIDICREYEEIYKELIIREENGENKPNSLGFWLWEKVKDMLRHAKLVLTILLFLALLAYLIYTILNPVYKGGDKIDYQNIGTLVIREEPDIDQD